MNWAQKKREESGNWGDAHTHTSPHTQAHTSHTSGDSKSINKNMFLMVTPPFLTYRSSKISLCPTLTAFLKPCFWLNFFKKKLIWGFTCKVELPSLTLRETTAQSQPWRTEALFASFLSRLSPHRSQVWLSLEPSRNRDQATPMRGGSAAASQPAPALLKITEEKLSVVGTVCPSPGSRRLGVGVSCRDGQFTLWESVWLLGVKPLQAWTGFPL